MALEPLVIGIIQRDFMNIAEDVKREFKAEVHRNLKHPRNSSGRAEGSIDIMQQSPDRILVGSDDQHLNFLVRGNGGSRIPHGTPRVKPKAPMPMTFGARGSAKGFAMSVNPYAGKPQILTNVANKFR